MKTTFTAVDEMTGEFPQRSDIESAAGSRFKIIHPSLLGAILDVQQKLSDGEWYTIYQISSGYCTVIDTPDGGLYRIKCSTYGSGSFSVFCQE